MVIGATGQLGSDLVRTFDQPGELVALSTRDVDILDSARTRSMLETLRPTCVINTAAYNLVDRAEDDERSAFALNAEAVGTLAAICQAAGARLVHFSTDYVFDGAKRTPYLETDSPQPVSVYGESKLAGERLALERCERSVIFRVCGLFGLAGSLGKGKGNFVETMLRLAREGRPLRVVSDQVLCPSYTLDLARKVWKVLPKVAHPVYHLTNAGQVSWYEFARRALELAGVTADLTPVTAAEYGARARRPAYSVLAHAHLAALGEDDLRPWDAALPAYVAERSSSR
ncbi:MAG: dTDP-4-dehydrorhamnose reductase [Candidatus Rokuibacteriota bacterium]|nr:MAG: dTDP-4-dehydrorhamnose reductase [Candidatus Rokubacteria bacterium]PYO05969.1 MAG: dTDP-4-dehydrorhamnose reductase [Candidatus Rokubacteria bacterium]